MRKSNDEDNPPGTTDGPGSTTLRMTRLLRRIPPLSPRAHIRIKNVQQTLCQVLGKGIELVLQNQEVMLGDSATFRLRLLDDTDEAGEWTRDDVTLTQSEKTHISINGRDRQLTVTDVHPADTGEYAYRVGEDMTSAHLSINEAYCFGSVPHPPPPPIIPI